MAKGDGIGGGQDMQKPGMPMQSMPPPNSSSQMPPQGPMQGGMGPSNGALQQMMQQFGHMAPGMGMKQGGNPSFGGNPGFGGGNMPPGNPYQTPNTGFGRKGIM